MACVYPPKGAKVYPTSRLLGSKDSWLLIVCHDIYHGIQKAVHQFRFKNVEQHILLGSGGNQNLRPSCRRPPARTFHIPVGTVRLDAPALVRVPMMEINWDEVN